MKDKRTGEHTHKRTRIVDEDKRKVKKRSKRPREKENTRTRAKVDKKKDIRRLREQRKKNE